LWHREGNQFMHFNVVQPNGVLYGVIIYEFDDDRRLLGTLFAERAIFQANHWLLEDVVENRIYETHTERVSVRSKPWKTELSSNLLNILVLDPLDLSVLELWRYANYLDSQNLNSGPYRLAFWEKVLQPLSTLALVLVAISIVFGPLREVTMGFRIFVGVLIGIVFRTAQDMLGPASLVYGFQPIYASLLPVLVGVVFGVWFLRRAN
ncbi:MAG: lipopolysaccharide export system permease protein, partial [Lentisphaeria bacterium]